jgi:phospholipid-binding lipoprotein MlaA
LKVLKSIFLFIVLLGTYSYADINTTESNFTSKVRLVSSNQSKLAEANISDSNVTIVDNFEDEFKDSNNSTANRFDPLEPYNRAMTQINDKMIIHILDPMVERYNNLIPEGGRVAVHRFFKNAKAPVRVANNLLQFKLRNATEETGRFVVNTIFGLGGFFDPAESDLHWVEHDEDFGQTLGYYGVSDAIPIVLPILGPSNLRDVTGMAVDGYLNPLRSSKIGNSNYKIAKTPFESLLYKGGDMFNRASLHVGEYHIMRNDALDLYTYLQDAYSEHENEKIKE